MHVCSHYSTDIVFQFGYVGFARFGYVTASQTYGLSTGVMTNGFVTAPGSNNSSCFIGGIDNL